MRNRIPLIVFALFLPLSFGAWKWANVLEARFENRLQTPQKLQVEIVKGGAEFLSISSISDDFAVIVSGITGLSAFKVGTWQIETIQFRPISSQNWKKLLDKSWRGKWKLFEVYWGTPSTSTRKTIFSLFNDDKQHFLSLEQYQLRAHYNEEYQDGKYNVSYLAAESFDFFFHVDPASNGEKRVILDSVQKVG